MKSPRSGKKLSPHELALFLFYLARTGNFAFACDRLGRAKSGLYKRRARDPDFAAECGHALALARSSLWRTEGGRRPGAADAKSATTLSSYAGRPQLRRATPGTLTRTGRQRFLETLAATGNIRFAAHSVGVAPSSIHHRRRTHPDFAAQVLAALDTAAAALELRVIEASGVFLEDPLPREGEGQGEGGGGRDQDSVRPERVEGSDRTSAPRAIAALTTAEALRFLTLHQRKRR